MASKNETMRVSAALERFLGSAGPRHENVSRRSCRCLVHRHAGAAIGDDSGDVPHVVDDRNSSKSCSHIVPTAQSKLSGGPQV
jgi:hypothetical protein